MRYEEVIYYIENSMKFGCRPGLERTAKLLELLGNPHKRLRTVHIAGTNGKGSTTAMVANTLKCAGYKTGMYISPHLYKNTERMSIDGVQISEDDFTQYAEIVIEKLEYMRNNGMEEPTQFETLTAMAFLYFEEKKVDFAVIEVGLGGAYDATNVIDAAVSVITSISYDHTDILGDTIEKIATEKAGIIKENNVTVLYPQRYPEAVPVIEKICAEKNSTLVRVAENAAIPKAFNIEGQTFDYINEGISLNDMVLPLLGDHQLKNAATAITTLLQIDKLGYSIPEAALREGIRTVAWPCRLSLVKKDPIIIIDGAHNEDGIDSLKTALEKYFSDKKIIFVIAMLKDKNYKYAIEQLMPLAHGAIATEPVSDRALPAQSMADAIKPYCSDVVAEKDIHQAIKKAAAKCDNDSMICICGSLYMAGSAYEFIVDMKGI